ncbi:ABC transporter ATP-binding protein [Shouchella clausii]|uniref:ABC transporter ATP-binding protein n=1 Tax=Shouchella clausii TaxID=79880 RepID=UPI0031FC8858
MRLRSALTEPFRYKTINWRASRQSQATSSQPQHPHAARAGGRPETAKDGKGAAKRIFAYLARQKGALFLVMALVFASAVLTLAGPFLIGVVIDDYIIPTNFDGLEIILLFLLGSYAALSISTFLQNFMMVKIAQATVFAIRKDLFAQLQKLPIGFFDKHKHGDLMSRMTNDIENISATLNSSIVQIISSVVTFIGILAVMLYLSPLLTVITLFIVPLMVLGMRWITKRTKVFFKEQQKSLGQLNGYSEETIAGQSVVKTFSREDTIIEAFEEHNGALRHAGFWAQVYSGFIPKLMNVLNNLSFAVIAGIGGFLAVHGAAGVTVGVIVVFVEYSRQFTRPLNDLANQFNAVLSALAGAERVFAVIDEEPEADQAGAITVKQIEGNVSFQNVCFSYGATETLKNVSFTAKAGETIAFVGPTGAGKTTILNLLLGFYPVNEGAIFIDGNNLANLKKDDVRSQMGVVLQDPFLFQGSIRENIRYGRLEASDQEVEEAAKLANAHGFISHLPNGYDTMLLQDGSGISQGQKQLLSIARALLANPSILILDEATSSIDTVTEMKIQEALKRLIHGRTSFVIAHRLNTIEAADQILVLQGGEVTEVGSHHELMATKGFYYEMQQTKQMDAIL